MDKKGVAAYRFGIVILLLSAGVGFCESYELRSPDRTVFVNVSVAEGIGFSVLVDGKQVLRVADVALTLADGTVLGADAQVTDVDRCTVAREVRPEVREKCAVIQERYSGLILTFGDDFTLTFRAYDNGVAYRFATSLPGDIVVRSENARFQFADKASVICQKEKSFRSSYEEPYTEQLVSDLTPENLCCLPALVTLPSGPKVLITESDLQDYPGLWLRGIGQASLAAAFAGYPLEESYEGRAYGHGRVTKHADYIAKTQGTRTYPWRVLALARGDGDLITNQLVYLLAPPLALDDISWIKPGVVTFDWWGRRNIYGVDFKAGVNTATAKYFIDFASEYGFKYFLFDDGWSDGADLFKINPDLDMEVVCAHAKQKHVGVMLWVIWATLDRQCEAALDRFAQWGIEGIKIDFMNRDDQKMVNFYHRIAREAAERHMVIDFHGAYKPAGLRRAYPNVLTREGLIEVEQNGWSDRANPEHHVLLPFIRMVAGPMDYIPGTMNNAQKHNFRPVGDRPMGLGTRAHDLALFVILESPMQMLPDAPSDYYREHECTEFIAQIPVEWDETRVLEAKVGDYVVLARRRGETWFVGAITDWDRRQFDLRLDFLDAGSYEMEVIRDGLNADVRAIDYKKEKQMVTAGQTLNINLAPGGGWVARIDRPEADSVEIITSSKAGRPSHVYYVDATGGDDSRDGRNPESAWRTLEKVNRASLEPGDKVLFKRGGQWRGQLVPQSGAAGAAIAYGAFGTGVKPLLLGSVAMNAPSDWRRLEDGIWTTRDSQGLLAIDVGNIIFDDGAAVGVKKWSRAELQRPGDYFYDPAARCVLLRSNGNPASQYRRIELALKKHITDQGGKHHVTYEDLALRYGAAHGIGGSGVHDIVVRRCDLSYIGGGHQLTRSDGRPVRYGNGIEFWSDAHDCLVEGCRLWEIYDAALTNQGSGTNVQENLTYRHNVIWNCEYSFEYWNRGVASRTHNIRFEHNTCVDAGYGWGHAQRPDRNGRHLMFYDNSAITSDVVLRYNIFCNATDSCLRLHGRDWTSALTMDENCWFQRRGPLLLWGQTAIGSDGFADHQRSRGFSAHARVVEPTFVNTEKRDYRLTSNSPARNLQDRGVPVGALP